MINLVTKGRLAGEEENIIDQLIADVYFNGINRDLISESDFYCLFNLWDNDITWRLI